MIRNFKGSVLAVYIQFSRYRFKFCTLECLTIISYFDLFVKSFFKIFLNLFKNLILSLVGNLSRNYLIISHNLWFVKNFFLKFLKKFLRSILWVDFVPLAHLIKRLNYYITTFGKCQYKNFHKDIILQKIFFIHNSLKNFINEKSPLQKEIIIFVKNWGLWNACFCRFPFYSAAFMPADITR